MEKGWVKILSTSAQEAELKCALLRSCDVDAVVINKQDSSYFFGEAELYVPQDQVIRAKRVLNEEDA